MEATPNFPKGPNGTEETVNIFMLELKPEDKFGSLASAKPALQTGNQPDGGCPPECGCIYKSKRKPRNTDFLDGFRAFAIFLVVAAHTGKFD